MVGRIKLGCACRRLIFAVILAAASSVFAADPSNGRRLQSDGARLAMS